MKRRKDLFDKDVLETLLYKEETVEARRHYRHPLNVLHYTDDCMFAKRWDWRSMIFRGMVYDVETLEVVAWPFPKFFDYTDKLAPTFDREAARFDAFEKLDGSLGVLWNYKGDWHFSTSLSFTSPQAGEAQKMLEEMYKDQVPKLQTDVTYLFEIVYPENKIVVDYASRRALVFLAAFETASGRELHLDSDELAKLEFPRPRVHRQVTLVELLKIMERETKEFDTGKTGRISAEGYIVRVPVEMVVSAPTFTYTNLGNRRWETKEEADGEEKEKNKSKSKSKRVFAEETVAVKVKFPLYLKTHKIGCYGRGVDIIALIREGRQDLCLEFDSATLGEDFKKVEEIKKKAKRYVGWIAEIHSVAQSLTASAKEKGMTMQAFAELYKDHAYKDVMCAVFRGVSEKRVEDKIYKILVADAREESRRQHEAKKSQVLKATVSFPPEFAASTFAASSISSTSSTSSTSLTSSSSSNLTSSLATSSKASEPEPEPESGFPARYLPPILNQLREKMGIKPSNVVAVIHYGSYVWGTNRPNSDRDLLVVVKDPGRKMKWNYSDETQYWHDASHLEIAIRSSPQISTLLGEGKDKDKEKGKDKDKEGKHKVKQKRRDEDTDKCKEKDKDKVRKFDLSVYSTQMFRRALADGFMLVLECLFVPDSFVWRDKSGLREKLRKEYFAKHFSPDRLAKSLEFERAYARNCYLLGKEDGFVIKKLFNATRYKETVAQLVEWNEIRDFSRGPPYLKKLRDAYKIGGIKVAYELLWEDQPL